MSKILEKIVETDLHNLLDSIDALPTTQCGFRRGRSTVTALAKAHADWNTAKGSGLVVGVMAFDLSAAFDTVPKDKLLPKLEALGLSGKALDWMNSYLSNGNQIIDWNGARSDPINIDYGVRQGSIDRKSVV